MFRLISHENNLSDIQTESLVSITGDPHEYEPSVMEIKKLISAPILITGPNELNPWIKKINFQRSKIPNLQTISILFDQKDYLTYPGANGEALSHFWLYPKVYCSLKSKLEADFKKLGHDLKLIKLCDSKKPETQLSSILIKIKKPIILTHDALLPLFLNLVQDKTHTIVAIKGSGHHEEANPESIKKMYNALAAPQVIWIQETGINIPQNIINKIRSNDIVIKIDTANSKDDDAFSVLKKLTQKLAPYAEKLP
ncbi:MAG: hypothetical protein PHY93_02110 [Bacteriovorax sp.]|nr:hypothetical protein [Bacteriovorax sp.]